MTEKENSFEALAEMWQQSQEAFVKAQEEIGSQFQKSLNEMAGTINSQAADPLAAWQDMIKAWVPSRGGNQSSMPSWPADLDFRKGQGAFFELLAICPEVVCASVTVGTLKSTTTTSSSEIDPSSICTSTKLLLSSGTTFVS